MSEQWNGFRLREDEGYNYFMPVSLLPPGKDGRDALVGAHYGENKRICITYKTDRDAVAKLLPPGFHPTDPCTISVCFAECRDIDYLAGGGYNLVPVGFENYSNALFVDPQYHQMLVSGLKDLAFDIPAIIFPGCSLIL